jgi:hypothetical protein
MDPSETGYSPVGRRCQNPDAKAWRPVGAVRGGTVQDLLYIGLTIVVFAALWLLVKGVERFER